MFYLQTKDGEKFFTDAQSNDKLEFEKIIESKLGKDASEMFNTLIEEAEGNNTYLLDQVSSRLDDCITDLDKALDSKDLDKARLEDILSELQAIYNIC